MDPLVSIVIPVYNGGNYLEQAINSALQQSYKNIEVVVVNDGSNDDGQTRLICSFFGDRIRYFEKENGGVGSALNFGIKNMSGSYFSWLSHDDLYSSEKIKEQVEWLQGQNLLHSDTVVYSGFYLISENGTTIGRSDHKPVLPFNVKIWLTGYSELNGCTLLIPKKAFDKNALFDESLRYTQDYDLWYRISSQFKFRYCHSFGVYSRQHSEQDTVKLNSSAMREVNALKYRFVLGLRKIDYESLEPDFNVFGLIYSLYRQKLPRVAILFFLKYIKYSFLTRIISYHEKT